MPTSILDLDATTLAKKIRDGEVTSVEATDAFIRHLQTVNKTLNTLGLPALVIPVGTDANGLPIAVQLLSKVGNEKALFHFGRRLEAQFRGYVRCTAHDLPVH